jgi:hypothetical protein
MITKSLAGEPQSLGNSLRLARHLALPDLIKREDFARRKIIELILKTVALAAPQTGTDKLEIFALPEVALVKEWRPEDKHLLKALVTAVNSSTVFAEYLPWLLGVIRILVANGPIEFAHFARPRVSDWVRASPQGRTVLGETGPFSTIQFSSTELGGVDHAIGLNVFELWRKLGTGFYSEWHTWADQMLVIGNPHPLALVSWSGVIVSLNSVSECANEGM